MSAGVIASTSNGYHTYHKSSYFHYDAPKNIFIRLFIFIILSEIRASVNVEQLTLWRTEDGRETHNCPSFTSARFISAVYSSLHLSLLYSPVLMYRYMYTYIYIYIYIYTPSDLRFWQKFWIAGLHNLQFWQVFRMQ